MLPARRVFAAVFTVAVVAVFCWSELMLVTPAASSMFPVVPVLLMRKSTGGRSPMMLSGPRAAMSVGMRGG